VGSTYCSLIYHIVYSTKERRPWIDAPIRQRLYDYMGGTVREHGGVLIAVNGTEDHVHLLMGLKQTITVADAVKAVKANSSRWVHQTFRDYRDFSWQGGYGAFTVSYSQRKGVEEYIANQQIHHSKATFQQEFLILLKKHHVEYDEKYIWD